MIQARSMELTLIGINESKQNMMSVLCSGVSQLKASQPSNTADAQERTAERGMKSNVLP